MSSNKSLLVHGLSENEINSLKELGNVIEIKPDMVEFKIHEIASGKVNEEVIEVVEVPNEKVILFNDFKDNEVGGLVKKVRANVQGGILAVVTPMSRNWSFKYLIDHLLEEREWYRKQQKGE